MKNKIKNNNVIYMAICAILILSLGLFSGATLFPNTIVNETIREVKAECAIVEPIVCPELPLIVSDIDLALSTFLKAAEDEEDEADNDFEAFDVDDYDSYAVKKVYDEYSVSFDEFTKTIVFKVKMKLEDNGDVEYAIYNIKVIFEEGENTIVELI